LKRIYHFLGSVYFAILIIVLTAVYTIVGTIIESKTQSHLKAAYFTYENPFFRFLLFLFFVNILIAALRRYPFKVGHIPFLMTHLGLLMILSGCIVKSFTGLQGFMLLKEGTASNTIEIPHSYCLKIENQDKLFNASLPFFGNTVTTPFDDLKITIQSFEPHCEESLNFFEQEKIVTLKNPIEVAKEYFINHAYVQKNEIIYPLKKILKECTFSLEDQNFVIYTDIKEEIKSYGNKKIKVSMEPSRLILEGSNHEIYCFFFNENGFIICYNKNTFPDIYCLDDGYGGYYRKITIPEDFDKWSLDYLIEKQRKYLEEELKDLFANKDFEVGPLNLFNNACKKLNQDPSKVLSDYLLKWQVNGSFLAYDNQKVISELDLSSLPSTTICGLSWIACFYQKLDQEFLSLEDVELEFVKKILKEEKTRSLQEMKIAQVLFLMGQNNNQAIRNQNNEALFSAFLISLGLKPTLDIQELFNHAIVSNEVTQLFSLVKNQITPRPSLQKWEDNKPMIELVVSQNGVNETIKLAYQTGKNPLKWPVLRGKYLFSFAPQTKKIPHKLRLREAKKILYPNSNEVFNYESDVIIDDTEETLAMNKIIETSKNYRFYMSSFQENDIMFSKLAIFTVNRDPAKNFLTYPGCFILSLGTALLFWVKRKNN
jgi:hypothetical protein